MSGTNVERRLAKIEARGGFTGDIATASDAQLVAIVRGAYRDLRAEHGGLAGAVRHLRGTGDAGDAALATLIEEDTGGPDARYH